MVLHCTKSNNYYANKKSIYSVNIVRFSICLEIFAILRVILQWNAIVILFLRLETFVQQKCIGPILP